MYRSSQSSLMTSLFSVYRLGAGRPLGRPSALAKFPSLFLALAVLGLPSSHSKPSEALKFGLSGCQKRLWLHTLINRQVPKRIPAQRPAHKEPRGAERWKALNAGPSPWSLLAILRHSISVICGSFLRRPLSPPTSFLRLFFFFLPAPPDAPPSIPTSATSFCPSSLAQIFMMCS